MFPVTQTLFVPIFMIVLLLYFLTDISKNKLSSHS